MLKGVEREVRSLRFGVESPFLLLFVIMNFCVCIYGRRDISAGAAGVNIWEIHFVVERLELIFSIVESKHRKGGVEA